MEGVWQEGLELNKKPNVVPYTGVFPASEHRGSARGHRWSCTFPETLQQGPEPNAITVGKCGMPARALQLFDEIQLQGLGPI